MAEERQGRTISLPVFLRNMLAEHLAAHDAKRDGLVFTTTTGAIVRQNLFLRRVFKPAVLAALPADLDALRFHDLRHTAASLFIAHGGQPKQVMERMGHADINTTYKRYGHLFPGHDSVMLDALDAAHADASNVIPLRPKEDAA